MAPLHPFRPANNMKMKLLPLMFFSTLCLFAYGQESNQISQSGQFGRLFTTPSERATIDHARSSKADLLSFDGYVIPKGGKTTTWANKVAEQSDTSSMIQVTQKPGRKPVISMQTESGKRVNLGVGDTVDLRTSAVHAMLDAPEPTLKKR